MKADDITCRYVMLPKKSVISILSKYLWFIWGLALSFKFLPFMYAVAKGDIFTFDVDGRTNPIMNPADDTMAMSP